jgi:branched-chain amino acid aminotransferase
MAAGTAAALVPIRSITCRSKGDKFTYLTGEDAGPFCVKLLTTLKGVQQGKIADQWGWLEKVPEPDASTYKKRNADAQNGVNGKNVDALP